MSYHEKFPVLPCFKVDAFTDKPFRGNPAAVVPLSEWPEDDLLQAIAMENNLSETAFTVPKADGQYHLRWFTPTVEVDLCGHATLATAFIYFEILQPELREITFETRAGKLKVRRGKNGFLAMDFPAYPPKKVKMTPKHEKCFDRKPEEILESGMNFMFVFEGKREGDEGSQT